MTVSIRSIAEMTPAERAEAVAEAAEALVRGELVVLPTETVYGLAGSAGSEAAMARLAAAKGRAPGKPCAWHSGSAEVVRDILGLRSPAHRRIARRLLPGPVTLLVEKTAEELNDVRRRIGAIAGAVDDGREVAVRATDHPIAQAVLTRAWAQGVPVAAEGIGGRPDAGAAHAACVLDDGPTRLGKPSTAVRLRGDGGYEVAQEGALSARYIEKLMERTILFVCTGNTCRSPMAAAIARHLLGAARREGPGEVKTIVRSAGVAAGDGAPAAEDAVSALAGMGVEMGRHASRELTRQMIAEADAVFAMTPEHRQMVVSIDPSAAWKIHTIDPEGGEVADPMGLGPEMYSRTAERLRELVERRLAALDDGPEVQGVIA